MAPKAKEKAKLAAAAPAVAIEDLFASLNRHIERSEFDQAVKISDQVLSIAPGDEDAIRCKIVALIKNDSVDKALSAIEQYSNKSWIDFVFFKAYCLYRKNKLDEALESLKGQEKNSAMMLLESQILFRLGKMDASVDIYQELQKSKIESLEINVVASLVSAGRASDVQVAMDSLRVKPTSSFELAYNTACSLIERNKYKDAEQLLLSARRIGQESLMEENLANDEIEIELAPIAVQLAYVHHILGNTQEAFESYTNVIKRNLADESSLAVATNNIIALKGPKDVADGLRKLDKLIEKGDGPQTFQLARGLDLKLARKQREAIFVNRLLLLLHSNKMDQARELAFALPSMFPDSVMPPLLQAAVHVRENKANKAEEILGHFADKFPDESKVFLLARAQVAASAGHLQIAAEYLLKISDIQHKPATVATIVSLKERVGDIEGADGVFDAAIQWWSNSMTEDNKLDIIMEEAASFKLRHGRKDEAARLYEELVKSRGSIGALVGLIQTTAHTNIEKAETYVKQLKPLPGLKAVDVGSLEKTSGAKHVENDSTASITEAFEAKSKEKVKKKRKRKPKYPKGFDPANPGPPPDPERWLPKRERSSFRPKRKDKRAAQIRGSQGAVSKEAATSVNPKSNQTTKGPSQNASAEQSKPSSKSRKKSKN
ncbi:signal recognition particle subunit SRP72-like [Olea europaea var. sylvestris]|uniref:signal recognition particle subunit SRP72-like n=1 Tax=Olea europaea var. sylvestris TaxID=158386 RepID=UPI000C1CFD11|nr:signal recognition particle subunit SRP72-like [Olea europaea var. sylvestris]